MWRQPSPAPLMQAPFANSVFPGPLLMERTLRSVGATLAASRHALEQGCGLQISGGYHHAHRNVGSGFCLFNDLVIAAQVCLDEGRCEQVLIVDLDVHQGMAAQHCARAARHHHPLPAREHNFPRHKPASHMDFPLPSGMADDAYLTTLAEALNLALRLYTPTSSSIRPGSMCTKATSLAISP